MSAKLNKRVKVFLTSLALAGSVFGIDYPVYTIETDAGTLSSPVQLDSLNVTRVASEGAQAEVVAFSAIGRPTVGTILKRGCGYVMSSTQLTNFTGKIAIEEGALCLDRPGQTGPANETAGILVVSNGATLAIIPTAATCVNYGMQVWCKVYAEGVGTDGRGAIFNGSTGVRVRETFKGGIALTGDLLIGGPGSSELGDVKGHNYELNGHTLIATGMGLCVNNGVIDSGNIVITNNSRIVFGSSFALSGGQENTFKVMSNATFSSYNAGENVAGWTLDLDDGAVLAPDGTMNDGWTRRNRNTWDGPVVTHGVAKIRGGANGCQGVAMRGSVSGEGGFMVETGWLNLYADNTFEGPLVACDTSASSMCGVGLHSRHAWPEGNDNWLSLTNACLWIEGDSEVRLPVLDLWADSGYVSNMVVFGSSTAVAAGLRKGGAASVTIETPMSVTGRTELASGTLRIASPVIDVHEPGLWESRYTNQGAWDKDVLDAYYTYGTIAPTNRVTRYPVLAEATNPNAYTTPGGADQWYLWDFARYEGYIWNREPTNAVYGFALAFCAKGKLYIDDALVLEGQGNWYYLRTNSVDLAPGPHKFDLRLYTIDYGTAGARSGYDMRFEGETRGNTEVSWTYPNWGFVWRRGEATPKCWDYSVPANAGKTEGGDGLVFTRSAEPACISVEFLELACRAGTTLDLCDASAPLFVPKFEGVTAVSGGSLVVRKSWTMNASDMNADGKLSVDGTLTFSEGVIFDLKDMAAVAKRKCGYPVTIAEADEIVGMPELSPALDGVVILEKSQDGKALTLTIPKRGMSIIIR